MKKKINITINLSMNIRKVLLLELLVFLILFAAFTTITCGPLYYVSYFIDVPSLIGPLGALVLGLLAMGAMKDFGKAFSVGIKKFTLCELKNTIEAISSAQKLVIIGGMIESIMGIVVVLARIDTPELIGPNLAVAILSIFYVVILEFFLLPLKFNAVKVMNVEMDFEGEESDEQ